jgi:hypothetical protein
MKSYTTFLFVLTVSLNAQTNQPKLRIDALGNVGVGTTNPSTKLEVNGAMTVGDLGQTEAPKAGTIKFDGQDFLGYDGTSWRSLTKSSNNSTIGTSPSAESISGSLLALPAGDPAPSGYSFLQAINKPFKWEELAPRNYKGMGGGLTVINDVIYHIGGSILEITESEDDELSLYSKRSVLPEKYDPLTNTWTAIPPQPFLINSKFDHEVTYGDFSVNYNGILYFFEIDKENFPPSIIPQYFNPINGIWKQSKTVELSGRDYPLNAIEIGGKIYLSMTPSAVTEPYEGFLVFDPENETWEKKTRNIVELPYGTTRSIMPGGPSLVFDNKILKFDSNNSRNYYYDIFDVSKEEWSKGLSIRAYPFDISLTYNRRIIFINAGMLEIFDPRTGNVQSSTIDVSGNDIYGSVIHGDYLYLLGAPNWWTASNSFYRTKLDGLLDLYIKD